jgi:hypothetical protein
MVRIIEKEWAHHRLVVIVVSLLTARVGKNSCGLSARDVKDSGRATS